jgi:hypothetical protein
LPARQTDRTESTVFFSWVLVHKTKKPTAFRQWAGVKFLSTNYNPTATLCSSNSAFDSSRLEFVFTDATLNSTFDARQEAYCDGSAILRIKPYGTPS